MVMRVLVSSSDIEFMFDEQLIFHSLEAVKRGESRGARCLWDVLGHASHCMTALLLVSVS